MNQPDMKLAWSLGLLMLGSPIGAQDRSRDATEADIRLIQAEADLLDESLSVVSDDDPRAGEFRAGSVSCATMSSTSLKRYAATAVAGSGYRKAKSTQ